MSKEDDDFEADSDPLPFTQVHRSVKNKAAMLSGITGVSFQHALGSLVCFWDLNGDAREIEALILAGENEVKLTREQVAQRILLASGMQIDPNHFATVGLLEPRGELFRVRGMSRFFLPVRSRLKRMEAARIAGLASAKTRVEKHGTAQPKSGNRRTKSKNRSADVRETFGERSAAVERTSNAHPNVLEPRVESRDVRVEMFELKETESPVASRQRSLTDRLEAVFSELRSGKKYAFDAADGVALAALMKLAGDEEIIERWRIGLTGTFDQKVSTLKQLKAKWNNLTATTAEPTSSAPRANPNAPVRAETQKFTQTGDVTEAF